MSRDSSSGRHARRRKFRRLVNGDGSAERPASVADPATGVSDARETLTSPEIRRYCTFDTEETAKLLEVASVSPVAFYDAVLQRVKAAVLDKYSTELRDCCKYLTEEGCWQYWELNRREARNYGVAEQLRSMVYEHACKFASIRLLRALRYGPK